MKTAVLTLCKILIFVIVLMSVISHVVIADSAPKKLQIGVKKRPAECPIKSKKGDMLSMHYTVSKFVFILSRLLDKQCIIYNMFSLRETNNQVFHQTKQNHYSHLFSGNLRRWHRIRQLNPQGSSSHIYPRIWSSHQRMGSRTHGHVRGRAEKASHPSRTGLRGSWIATKDSQVCYSDIPC